MHDYTIIRTNSPDGKKITLTIAVGSPDDLPFAAQQACKWMEDWAPSKKSEEEFYYGNKPNA